jgi:hypothetical protein
MRIRTDGYLPTANLRGHNGGAVMAWRAVQHGSGAARFAGVKGNREPPGPPSSTLKPVWEKI